jgi:hypothetical protein
MTVPAPSAAKKAAPATTLPDRLIRPTREGRITLVERPPAATPPAKGGEPASG